MDHCYSYAKLQFKKSRGQKHICFSQAQASLSPHPAKGTEDRRWHSDKGTDVAPSQIAYHAGCTQCANNEQLCVGGILFYSLEIQVRISNKTESQTPEWLLCIQDQIVLSHKPSSALSHVYVNVHISSWGVKVTANIREMWLKIIFRRQLSSIQRDG